MEKNLTHQRPTAPVIAARLCKEWGGRIALLFRQGDLYFEDGEEVPYAAIESWQEISFPEVESEYEKIRKHIIEILNRLAPCHWDGNEKGECLAHLEKQTEQKIIADRELTNFEIEIHEIIAQARSDRRLKDPDVLKQFEQEAACALMMKAKKEPDFANANKIEWSEEDELMLNWAIECCKKTWGEYPQKAVKWLKSLKDRIKGR